MPWGRIIVAGLFGLLMAGAASAGEPTECDRLAGSPTDPNRVIPGIGAYGIDPAEAVAACETALVIDPGNLFNLGRAHAASDFEKESDQRALAGQSFKAAAEKDYPAAQVALAAFHWFGVGGFQQATGEAVRLLKSAMASDAKEATLQRRHLFLNTRDEKQAALLYMQASEEGNSFGQYYLARFYEEGKGIATRRPRGGAPLQACSRSELSRRNFRPRPLHSAGSRRLRSGQGQGRRVSEVRRNLEPKGEVRTDEDGRMTRHATPDVASARMSASHLIDVAKVRESRHFCNGLLADLLCSGRP